MLRLREMRVERGLTLLDVALEMDVSQSAMQQYETGAIEPSIGMLVKLSDFYHVTIDYLVGKSPVREPITDEDQIIASQFRTLHNTAAKQAIIALMKEIRQNGSK